MNDRLLPPGYSRGVLISGFVGLVKYQGKTFVYYNEIVPWDVLIKFPMMAIMNAFSDRELFLARKQ